MIKSILVFGMFIIGITFGMAQQKEDKNIRKQQIAKANYEQLKTIVENKAFVFEAERASIPGNSTIQLFSIPNHLTINEGTIDMSLPYFGTIQVSGGTTEAGIEYRGKIQEYEVTYHNDVQKITIAFQTKETSERLDIHMDIKHNRASVTVLSMHRTTIQYYGRIQPIATEKIE